MSNVTCLVPPHLFSALFVVSRNVIVFATSFTTFEERLRQTSSVRQVVPPDGLHRVALEALLLDAPVLRRALVALVPRGVQYTSWTYLSYGDLTTNFTNCDRRKLES